MSNVGAIIPRPPSGFLYLLKRYLNKVVSLGGKSADLDDVSLLNVIYRTGDYSEKWYAFGIKNYSTTLVRPLGIHVAIQSETAYTDLAGCDQMVKITVSSVEPAGTGIYHALTTDREIWKIWTGLEWRDIVRLSGSTWEYRDDSDDWIEAESIHEAFRFAFSFSSNQMTTSTLNSLTSDEFHTDNGFPLNIAFVLWFAYGLFTTDIKKTPKIFKYSVDYRDKSSLVVETWRNGKWTGAGHWNDSTEENGVTLRKSGELAHYGGYSEATLGVINDVPGFWHRVRIRGTSPNTSLSAIRFRAQCQQLRPIPAYPWRIFSQVVNDTGATKADISVMMADANRSEVSSATVSLGPSRYLYLAYPYRFLGLQVIVFSGNTTSAILRVEVWDGYQWYLVPDVSDSTFGLKQTGEVWFRYDGLWRTCAPDGVSITLAYWARISASSNITAKISELRAFHTPNDLPKTKIASRVGDSVALISRRDAPDQVSVSRALDTTGWDTAEAAAYRTGTNVGFCAAVETPSGLLLTTEDDDYWLLTPGTQGALVPLIGVITPAPVSSRSAVSAPVAGKEAGMRDGVVLLSHAGIHAISGIRASEQFGHMGSLRLDTVLDWFEDDISSLENRVWSTLWHPQDSVVWITDSNQAQTPVVINWSYRTGAWQPQWRLGVSGVALLPQVTHEGLIQRWLLAFGDYSGRILVSEPNRLLDGENDIPWEFSSQWLDFGLAGIEKILRFCRIIFTPLRPGTITLDCFRDGEASPYASRDITVEAEQVGRLQVLVSHDSENISGYVFRLMVSGTAASIVHGVQCEVRPLRIVEARPMTYTMGGGDDS